MDFLSFPVFPHVSEPTALSGGVGDCARGWVLLSNEGSTEALAFLDKILLALQMERLRDCLTLVCEEQGSPLPHFTQLQRHQGLSRCILFGISPERLGWNIRLQPYTWLERKGKLWLLAHSLSDLQKNPIFKRYLWDCIKDTNPVKA